MATRYSGAVASSGARSTDPAKQRIIQNSARVFASDEEDESSGRRSPAAPPRSVAVRVSPNDVVVETTAKLQQHNSHRLRKGEGEIVCSFPIPAVASGQVEVIQLNSNSLLLRLNDSKKTPSGGARATQAPRRQLTLVFQLPADASTLFEAICDHTTKALSLLNPRVQKQNERHQHRSAHETPHEQKKGVSSPSGAATSPYEPPSDEGEADGIYSVSARKPSAAPNSATRRLPMPSLSPLVHSYYAADINSNDDNPSALTFDKINNTSSSAVDRVLSTLDTFEHDLTMEQLFSERDRRRQAFLDRIETLDRDNTIRSELSLVHTRTEQQLKQAQRMRSAMEHDELEKVWLRQGGGGGASDDDAKSITESEDAERRYTAWKSMHKESTFAWKSLYGDIAADEERRRQDVVKSLRSQLQQKQYQLTHGDSSPYHLRHRVDESSMTEDSKSNASLRSNSNNSSGGLVANGHLRRDTDQRREARINELRQMMLQFDEFASPRQGGGNSRESILGEVKMLLAQHEEEARLHEQQQRQMQQQDRSWSAGNPQQKALNGSGGAADAVVEQQMDPKIKAALEVEAKLISSVRYVPAPRPAPPAPLSPNDGATNLGHGSITLSPVSSTPLQAAAVAPTSVAPQPQPPRIAQALQLEAPVSAAVASPVAQLQLPHRVTPVMESPSPISVVGNQALQSSNDSSSPVPSAARPSPLSPPSVATSQSGWRAMVDAASGKTYYVNKELKKTTWKIEETYLGAVGPARNDGEPSSSTAPNTAHSSFAAQQQPGPGWKATVDAASGKTYYVNKELKKTTWKIEETQLTGGAAPLPAANNVSDWLVKTAPDGKTYYVNPKLKKTTWKIEETDLTQVAASRQLPDGWKEAKHPQTGRVYYVHVATKKTSWEFPTS